MVAATRTACEAWSSTTSPGRRSGILANEVARSSRFEPGTDVDGGADGDTGDGIDGGADDDTGDGVDGGAVEGGEAGSGDPACSGTSCEGSIPRALRLRLAPGRALADGGVGSVDIRSTIELEPLNDGGGAFGYQKFDRTTGLDPGTKISARYLQICHINANPAVIRIWFAMLSWPINNH